MVLTMTGCVRCGSTDELLFTCGHCDEQFCAAHQFPHHACSRFSDAGRREQAEKATESAGFEFGDGTTILTPPQPAADPGDESSVVPVSETDSRSVPGPRVEVARDAARSTRPDREGTAPLPPNRGMPWERDSGSVVDWMAAQSYPAYILKVSLLSLVFTAAYYGGLAATLYGYV